MSPPEQSSPAATTAAWMAAVTKRDAAALRELLTDDYELWPNAAPPVLGPDAAVQGMHDLISKFRVEETFDLRDSIAAEDVTFQWGIERITLTPVDGGNATTIVQRTMLLFRRDDDGRWRYARGMTNAAI